MKCTLEENMKVTTKELRIQPGKIIEQVANGQEITITFRGKALARIVPISKKDNTTKQDDIDIFGMWSSHKDIESVEDAVRDLRKERTF
jgi:prevent-host-death family protein